MEAEAEVAQLLAMRALPAARDHEHL